MKKVLFSALFAACASLSLSACMNGDYDATPDTNNGTPNPLSQTNGGSGGGGGGSVGTAAKGEIRFSLNGRSVTLGSGTYMDGNPRIMSGGNTTTSGGEQVGFIIDNYTGPATYTITTTANRGRYTLINYAGSPITKDYLTSNAGGTGEIKVTSDANNEMIGTFSFTAFYNGEKVDLTSGSFDLPKQ